MTVGSTCLCCYHKYLLRGHHPSQTVSRQNKSLWSQRNLFVIVVCLVCYLVRVDHIRTAVTGIPHPIVVSVFLVWVWDSLAVVKNIL